MVKGSCIGHIDATTLNKYHECILLIREIRGTDRNGILKHMKTVYFLSMTPVNSPFQSIHERTVEHIYYIYIYVDILSFVSKIHGYIILKTTNQYRISSV